MKTGSKGRELIKKYEGLRLTAYKCPAGVWTIGYGHTAGVKSGQKISKQEAEDMLTKDLEIYESHVNKLARDFTQNQFDALVSFCYNLGPGCLQTLVKNRDNKAIASAILLYNKAAGKILPGLVKRRKQESELFLYDMEEDETPQLPYKVVTNCILNIRKGPSTKYEVIRTVQKNTILTVWAIETKNNEKWGKNGSEYFCLDYCTIK